MADVALWSGATGANNGTSWADAYTTIAAAITGKGQNPTRIFVASDHSELVSANIAFPISPQNLYQIISCDRTSGFPPTVEQAGAHIGSSSSFNLTIQNGFYSKGVFWSAGDNSTSARNLFFDCTFYNHVIRIVGGGINLKNTGGTSRFLIGTGSTARNQRIKLENAEVRFGSSGQGFQLYNGALEISGGAVAGAAITEFIKAFSSSQANVDVSGLDMSACASGFNLVAPSLVGCGKLVFDRCKMPSGWNGSISSSPPSNPGLKTIVTNCDSADTNYRILCDGYNANMRQETTIVRTGGASDGVTPISWAVVTGVMTYPAVVMDTPLINVWNETIGSAVTVTAEVITDGVPLTDEDAWIEVSYLSNTGFPLGAMVSDEKSNMLAAASTQDSSSVAWTTTGLTSPVKQKLSVTFTPQEKGFISACVKVARSNTTVYVCPKIEVS